MVSTSDVPGGSGLVGGAFEGTRKGGEIRGAGRAALCVEAFEEDANGGADTDNVEGYMGKSWVSILGEKVAALGTDDDARRFCAGVRFDERGASVLEAGVIDSREAATK